MFKSVVFHERRPELSRAQFMKHWLTVHAPMSEGTRDLHGYSCNEVIADVTPRSATPLHIGANIDGIAHMWFRTPDGLVTLPKDQPNVQRWFADGPNFIGRRVRFMGEEEVIEPPARDGASMPKVSILAASGKGRDTSEVLEKALKGPACAGIQRRGLALTRILSNHATTSITGFPMDAFDHVVEIWLSDEAHGSHAAAATIEALMPDVSSVRALLTREHVIRIPSAS